MFRGIYREVVAEQLNYDDWNCILFLDSDLR